MALGLGLFALAMVVAVAIGSVAAKNSHTWDETKHISLIRAGNGNGKH